MKIEKIVMALAVSMMFVGCGDSDSSSTSKGENEAQEQGSGSQGNGNDNSEGTDEAAEKAASYIPYLKENHKNYAQHGSMSTPAPTKDATNKSIDWTISATTTEGAKNLVKHIQFMVDKLEADKNPRGFDKLFLMEAYMKFNHKYTTLIEQEGTSVIVSKKANTMCAYKVISAHSDSVSGDFFAQGVLDTDYSSIAEKILNSSACTAEKSTIEAYIVERQKTKK